jgi:hypothetical protein
VLKRPRYVARIEDIRNPYRISTGNPEGKNSLSDLGVDGRIKVKLSLCLTKHHAMKAYWGMEV